MPQRNSPSHIIWLLLLARGLHSIRNTSFNSKIEIIPINNIFWVIIVLSKFYYRVAKIYFKLSTIYAISENYSIFWLYAVSIFNYIR